MYNRGNVESVDQERDWEATPEDTVVRPISYSLPESRSIANPIAKF